MKRTHQMGQVIILLFLSLTSQIGRDYRGQMCRKIHFSSPKPHSSQEPIFTLFKERCGPEMPKTGYTLVTLKIGPSNEKFTQFTQTPTPKCILYTKLMDTGSATFRFFSLSLSALICWWLGQ